MKLFPWCTSIVLVVGMVDETFKTHSPPPPPPINNFCLYPPNILRCFRKDSSMCHPHFRHLPLLSPSPFTTLTCLHKNLIVHMARLIKLVKIFHIIQINLIRDNAFTSLPTLNYKDYCCTTHGFPVEIPLKGSIACFETDMQPTLSFIPIKALLTQNFY